MTLLKFPSADKILSNTMPYLKAWLGGVVWAKTNNSCHKWGSRADKCLHVMQRYDKCLQPVVADRKSSDNPKFL